MPSTEVNHGGFFPRCLAELTPNWLSDVLGVSVAEVDAIDIGEGKGMLGDVWRLRLILRDAEPLEVVAKFSAQRESSLPLSRRAEIFEREINFYRRIAPHLRCRLPRVYGGWHDHERAEFLIVMEHIDADSSVDQKRGVSFDHASQVMIELAALHSFNIEESVDVLALANVGAPERRANQRFFIENGWDKLKDLLHFDADGSRETDRLTAGISAAYDRLAALPNVLCHGDVRPDNLLFSRDGRSVVLIDWQGVAVGPRCWDLAYFFAQGLRAEDRREWQAKLLNAYVEAASKLGEEIDMSLLVDGIGSAAWFSLAVACSLFTVADTTQPGTLELAKSMGERAISFLRDEKQI